MSGSAGSVCSVGSGSSRSHRSSSSKQSARGRSHAPRQTARDKLPPIPERSLSSQKKDDVGAVVVAGVVEGVDVGAKSIKKAVVAAAPPRSDESRQAAEPRPAALPRVATDESRDDDEQLVQAAAAPSPPSPPPTPTSPRGKYSVPKDPPASDEVVPESHRRGAASGLSSRSVSRDSVSVVSARVPSTSENVALETRLVSLEKTSVVNKPKSKTIATQTLPDDDLAHASTPYTSNVSRKRISSVVGTACDDDDARSDDAMERTEAGATNATRYTPEPSWEDFALSRSECTPDDAREITTIPSDEIIDSFMRKPRPKKDSEEDSGNLSDEELLDYNSRDTRDQYQLGRLQARINRRRQFRPQVARVEKAPSAKTLRSSRIKTVRNLYSSGSGGGKNFPSSGSSSQEGGALSPSPSSYSGGGATSSVHGSISNVPSTSTTTIPSLVHGQTITSGASSSVVSAGFRASSSASGVRAWSNSSNAGTAAAPPSLCDEELSEYRGKLFAKMLKLLQGVTTTADVEDDIVSSIKERVIEHESLASVAELKLIQKLTEEEMSRILFEFERNNSLVEKKEHSSGCLRGEGRRESSPPLATAKIASGQRAANGDEEEEDEDDHDAREAIIGHDPAPPRKIVYQQHDHTTIASKLSDVTSPTCHDGFELDEIMPIVHRQPMISLPPLPRSGGDSAPKISKQRLPPSSLSPAAAAAASAAASMMVAPSVTPPDAQLPSSDEMGLPDSVELDEDHSNDMGNGCGVEEEGPTSVVEEEEEKRDEESLVSKDDVEEDGDADNEASIVNDDDEGIENDVNEEEVEGDEERDGTDKSEESGNSSGKETTDSENRKAAEILASSRETVKRIFQREMEEEHFYDELLTAAYVKKGDDDFELDEVTSILSQYEEADMKLREDEEMVKKGAVLGKIDEDEEGSTSLPFDESSPVAVDEPASAPTPAPAPQIQTPQSAVPVPPRKVSFLEPLEPMQEVQDQAMCTTCTIQ